MFPLITASEAAGRSWDVIIGGSSFAAMFFLRNLPGDLAVLVIEKGRLQPHAEQIAGQIDGLETFQQTNASSSEKNWAAHSVYGGNSNCWWAVTPRLHPSDFRLKTLYGIGEDWPVSYDDLAPYYHDVEVVMQVSGGGSDHILPRDQPFPFPPHVPSRTDLLFRAHSPNWFAQPTARANGGDRAQCCANGVCDRCPVDAKFTVINSFDAFARPNTHLLLQSEIRAVRIDAGQAKAVQVQGEIGGALEITGDVVALGTNAISNAAILLRSGVSHPNLGRGLNEQASILVEIDGDDLGYFGGTSITGHGYDLYDGAHRRDHSGVLIEVFNSPVVVRNEFAKWDRRTRLKLIVEDLPAEKNRVLLDAGRNDAPLLEWHGHSDYALDGIKWGVAQLPEILPEGIEITLVSDLAPTEYHLLGTHRMGNDPQLHVTDDRLKVRGVSGLLALGGGNFTTTAPANPTLTISALSSRAASLLT